ncbi:MAG: hypothetical protein RR428_10610 [Coprobacillus sp.]
MKNSKVICIMIGAIIYLTVSLVDRFIVRIDNIIYLPIVILAILFMLIGIIRKGQD